MDKLIAKGECIRPLLSHFACCRMWLISIHTEWSKVSEANSDVDLLARWIYAISFSLVYLSSSQWHSKLTKVGLCFNKHEEFGMVTTKLDGFATRY